MRVSKGDLPSTRPTVDSLPGDVFNLPREQREELFVSMIESLFDGVVVTDPQGLVLYLNSSM